MSLTEWADQVIVYKIII